MNKVKPTKGGNWWAIITVSTSPDWYLKVLLEPGCPWEPCNLCSPTRDTVCKPPRSQDSVHLDGLSVQTLWQDIRPRLVWICWYPGGQDIPWLLGNLLPVWQSPLSSLESTSFCTVEADQPNDHRLAIYGSKQRIRIWNGSSLLLAFDDILEAWRKNQTHSQCSLLLLWVWAGSLVPPDDFGSLDA